MSVLSSLISSLWLKFISYSDFSGAELIYCDSSRLIQLTLPSFEEQLLSDAHNDLVLYNIMPVVATRCHHSYSQCGVHYFAQITECECCAIVQ